MEATGTQLLSTESAEISQVIVSKQVSEIPLNGRQLAAIDRPERGRESGRAGETGSPNPVNVNGQRDKANLFLVDGISTTSSAQGRGNDFNIPLEAVREFSVQAGSYSAEYGNVAGGVINLESKSGTNNWHGSLFEFFRNDGWTRPTSSPTPPASPRIRFATTNSADRSAARSGTTRRSSSRDYQGTITHKRSPMVTSVPLDAAAAGRFLEPADANGAPVPIYDPFGASLARTPFPNNTIPLHQPGSRGRQDHRSAAAPEPVRCDRPAACRSTTMR